MMSRIARLLPWLLFLVFAAAAAAQKEKEPNVRFVAPDKYERETKVDDKGLTQWAEWKAPKCDSCVGTGKTRCLTCFKFDAEDKHCIECKRNKDSEATCRSCAGLGQWPDPMTKVACPECMSAGFVLCLLCSGRGQIKATADGGRASACPICRGEGGFKCGTCNGARLVDVAVVKPNVKDASAATLQKAIAQTEQAIAALEAFKPGGKDTRKEVKELVKAYGPGVSLFPPLKKTAKDLEDAMAKVYGGNQYQGFEEREDGTMTMFQKNTAYFLKHQKRMLELAHKRAEANEKVLAEQKANKGK